MEYLNSCLKKLRDMTDYNFHTKCTKLAITHVEFVEDLMLFCRGDLISVRLMMAEFRKFDADTRLKAYFRGECRNDQQAITDETGFNQGVLPFKYLGVLLSSRRVNVN